jgi:hypothetical protein
MIIGSTFTLFVLPAIYVLVARTHRADTVGAADTAEPKAHPVRELEEAAV